MDPRSYADSCVPHDINTEECVNEEEVERQTALLISLLVKEGYDVKIKHMLVGHSVIEFKRNKDENSIVYSQVADSIIRRIGEDGEGVRNLVFTTVAMNVLREKGYNFDEYACNSYNYPCYRRITMCFLPDGNRFSPKYVTDDITSLVKGRSEIKANDINICEQLERNIRIAQYFILGLVKTN